MAHDFCPRTSRTGASIEHQGRPLFKTEAGQSVVLRIVNVPATTDRPVATASASPNGAPALLVNRGFELTPAQDKLSLIVNPLFSFDPVDSVQILAHARLDARGLELRVYFRVDGSDQWQVTHSLQGSPECAGIERPRLTSIRKRRDLPLRRLKVFCVVDNHVVVLAGKKIQSPVCADDPQASRLQAC